jgi:hypothetical protein
VNLGGFDAKPFKTPANQRKRYFRWIAKASGIDEIIIDQPFDTSRGWPDIALVGRKGWIKSGGTGYRRRLRAYAITPDGGLFLW